jgi:hypothetical protein
MRFETITRTWAALLSIGFAAGQLQCQDRAINNRGHRLARN